MGDRVHNPQMHIDAAKHLVRRRRADFRFRVYCQAMVVLAVAFVIVLLGLIAHKSYSAFTRHYLQVPISALSLEAEPTPADISRTLAQIESTLRSDLEIEGQTTLSRDVFSRLALISALKDRGRAERERVGDAGLLIAVDHELDLYLKNQNTLRRAASVTLDTELVLDAENSYRLRSDQDGIPDIWLDMVDEAGGEILIQLGPTWFEYGAQSDGGFSLRSILGPQPPQLSRWDTLQIYQLSLSSHDRQLSNRQIALAETLSANGYVVRHFNRDLFTHADSTLPEIAGAAAALVGTVLTLLVTSLFALPIGILAAIYLEELAPSNRLTHLLEININNLAAIPSIIFGLLGAAVFLNTFGMPRSVPLVGGLVLGLLVLPTVIISSRAALAAVPQDLRDATLALGASRMQMVFHHILPVAGPGIVTGAILAMARAIGETAPLLLIGMVAFIHEIPTRVNDEATVLPVLIFKWFGSAERAWDPMTAAVVIVLLTLLLILNAIATAIRWRIDRTWTRR